MIHAPVLRRVRRWLLQFAIRYVMAGAYCYCELSAGRSLYQESEGWSDATGSGLATAADPHTIGAAPRQKQALRRLGTTEPPTVEIVDA